MRRLRLPAKLHAQHPGRKWVAALVLALLSAGLAAALRAMPGTSVPLSILDDVFYDAFYQSRTPEDRTNGDVVLVVVDGVLVVVAGVLAVVEPELEFEFAVVELVLCVSVALQPIKMAAERIQKIKRDFFSIWFAPYKART